MSQLGRKDNPSHTMIVLSNSATGVLHPPFIRWQVEKRNDTNAVQLDSVVIKQGFHNLQYVSLEL